MCKSIHTCKCSFKLMHFLHKNAAEPLHTSKLKLCPFMRITFDIMSILPYLCDRYYDQYVMVY